MEIPTFKGRIIQGAGRGKKIGFPTLNVDVHDVPPELTHGIYAGRVHLPDESIHLASFHYGPSPVFDADVTFEAFLLDVTLGEAPEKIEIEVHAFLREIRNFPHVDELVKQIARDVDDTRGIMRSR